VTLLGRVAAVLIITAGLTVFRGAVIQQLWEWFVVPLGVAALSLAAAVGIGALVTVLSPQLPEDNDRSFDEEMVRLVMMGVLLYSLALLTGWVAHQFV